MSSLEQLHKLEIETDVSPGLGNLSLIWEKKLEGIDIFHFQNRDKKPVNIPDDADYLLMFCQLAEQIFKDVTSRDTVFQSACSLGGAKLYLKVYTPEEKERFRYESIALSSALNKLPKTDYPGRISFSGTLSYIETNNEAFKKEAGKVANILKEKNKDDWMLITENKYDFIKTNVYVLDLQKLHSWGFQAVKPGGEIESGKSLVRPILPKPRGATRNKKRKV